jgi:glycosyltransferase involved in cell wall biosynthesis
MRILMLTPYVPYPPASGGQIRTYNILKQLSKHHEVHLVALYKTDEEKMAAPHLQHYCTSLHLCRRPKKPWQANTICKAITGSHPFLIVRNYSQEASQVIQKLLQAHTFDVIHAETFYVMPHIPHTSIPIFLVEQTVEYLVYQHFIESKPWFLKYPLSLDTRKLLHWEKTYWRQASLVAAVSDADATTIAKLDPTIHPIVIPNGAGDDMYVPKRSFERSRKKLFFLGNFQWLQNVEAARLLLDHIFPQALSQMPDLELVIAGQHIQRLTSTNHQSHITYVELHNEPETRVKELFLESDMFVAPIFGPGGTVKVITPR